MTRLPLFLLAGLILGAAPLLAGDAAPTHDPAPEHPDKSQYNLFHPTPVADLRDFNPDRPSQGDSAETIDAGHVQLETDLANYTFDVHNPQRAPVRTDQWNVFPPVVRIGLIDRAELDLEYDGYLNVRTRDHTVRPTQVSATSGVGDLTIASKINLWGNDGGKTALAIFPSLKIPTNTAGLGNDSVEGNVKIPLDVQLPADFKLNVETGFGFVRNDPDTHYVAQFINVISLEHTLGSKNLAGYVEFYSEVTAEHATPVSGQLDLGVTYQIGNNVQIDGGCNIGVTRAAPDYEPFAGFAVRF